MQMSINAINAVRKAAIWECESVTLQTKGYKNYTHDKYMIIIASVISFSMIFHSF